MYSQNPNCLNSIEVSFSSNGDQYWHQNGKRHRDYDLPAIIMLNGNQFWYKYGKLHRDNGLPAVVLTNGDQYWYTNGELKKRFIHDKKEDWMKEGF